MGAKSAVSHVGGKDGALAKRRRSLETGFRDMQLRVCSWVWKRFKHFCGTRGEAEVKRKGKGVTAGDAMWWGH